jgi:hypothetical protein
MTTPRTDGQVEPRPFDLRDAALEAASYYIDRLRTAHSGRRVTDLEEAGEAYYRLAGLVGRAPAPMSSNLRKQQNHLIETLEQHMEWLKQFEENHKGLGRE